MNQLKKTFLALAVVVALGLIGANNASAQQTTCVANSVPTLVRSQGIAELTGSIVLNCTASGATAAASITDTIQPSAAVITNNPAGVNAVTAVANSGSAAIPAGGPFAAGSCTGGATVTCVAPAPPFVASGCSVVSVGTTIACTSPAVTLTGCTAGAPTVSTSCTGNTAVAATSFLCSQPTAGNVVPTITTVFTVGAVTITAACQGAVSGNTVTFPIPACSTFVAATGVTTPCAAATAVTITIGVNPGLPAVATVGIRANVFASGITFPAQIAALLTSSPAGVIAVTNNFLNVAIPQNGLNVTFGSTPALTDCTSAALKGTPTTLALAAGTFTAVDPVSLKAGIGPTALQTVNIFEGFSSAFLPHTAPVTASGDEGADASQGTRIVLAFAALPSNVIVLAGNTLVAGSGGISAAAGSPAGLELDLVAGAGADGSGGTPTTGGLSATPAAGVTGAGATVITGTSITYEVTKSSNSLTEGIIIPIGMYTIGTPAPPGTSTVAVNLGPTSTIGTAIVTPIPRFGVTTAVGNLVVVVKCLTNIFFPWVANTAGYDSGFAIANTTIDPFGTTSQSGTCTYNFYGTNPPSGGTFTTAAFGGGVTDTRILSAVAPGFYGYVIVVCNFQLGHGFEFISNGFGGGSVTVGQGGPGLIIPQPLVNGTGTGSRKSNAGLAGVGGAVGEALGH